RSLFAHAGMTGSVGQPASPAVPWQDPHGASRYCPCIDMADGEHWQLSEGTGLSPLSRARALISPGSRARFHPREGFDDLRLLDISTTTSLLGKPHATPSAPPRPSGTRTPATCLSSSSTSTGTAPGGHGATSRSTTIHPLLRPETWH